MTRTGTAVAACAFALALVGCGREPVNANAPGSPGTGNPAQTVAPQAADGPPGGSSGATGSAPHTGASGADAVPGTTGSGGTNVAGEPPAQHGGGLHGGVAGSLPAETQSMGAGADDGSTNKRSATGNP